MSRSMLSMKEVPRLWSRSAIHHLAVLLVVSSLFFVLVLGLRMESNGSMGLDVSMDLFLVFLAAAHTLLIVVLVSSVVLYALMFQV